MVFVHLCSSLHLGDSSALILYRYLGVPCCRIDCCCSINQLSLVFRKVNLVKGTSMRESAVARVAAEIYRRLPAGSCRPCSRLPAIRLLGAGVVSHVMLRRHTRPAGVGCAFTPPPTAKGRPWSVKDAVFRYTSTLSMARASPVDNEEVSYTPAVPILVARWRTFRGTGLPYCSTSLYCLCRRHCYRICRGVPHIFRTC